MKERKKIIIVGIVALLCIGITVYFISQSKKVPDAKNPPSALVSTDIGILDMQKVIRAHPSYQETVELKKEINMLAAQAEKLANFHGEVKLDFPSSAPNGLYEAANQKINQQMTEKHAALNEKLRKQEQELYERYAVDLDKDISAIDDQYVPEIFNLQLKMKTLQMSKEAQEETVAKVQALQQERAEKSGEKQRAFAAKINDEMKARQDEALKELLAYEQELKAAKGQEIESTQQEIAQRNLQAEQQGAFGQSAQAEMSALQNELGGKEQALRTLQDKILSDIADKTAKLALENQLSVVITKVEVNVKAMELTDQVIAAFNKP